MVVGRLEEQSGPLGIRFVGKYNETRIPKYPAVVIIPGERTKEIHATQTFNVVIELKLYVYHGDLTLTKRERSEADMLLVTAVEQELEKDYEWKEFPNIPGSKRVVFAYVSDEKYGVLQPRSSKSNAIISTVISWRALTQRRF
jgi:hypothetical protein